MSLVPHERLGEVLPVAGSVETRLEGPGYLPPPDLPYDVWAADLGLFANQHRWSPWWIGDAINFGLATFGEIAWQALGEDLGLKLQTLNHYAYLAREFPPSMRIDGLSPSHHAMVVGLPQAERSRWLEQALESGWKQKRLNVEVHRARRLAELAQDAAPQTHERYRLDVRELADVPALLAGTKVDLLFADSPYDEASLIPICETLSLVAPKVLRRGGLCLVMVGNLHSAKAVRALEAGLTHQFDLAYLVPGPASPVGRHLIPQHKPIIALANGSYDGPTLRSVVKSDLPEKDLHPWQQSESGLLALLSMATLKGWTVLDPLCGQGSTGVAALRCGCCFIGTDRDPTAVAATAARLSSTALALEAEESAAESRCGNNAVERR